VKHKRKIFTAAIFLIVFAYLLITIVGLLRDIKDKKKQEIEMGLLIRQQEDVYNKLLEQQKLLEEMDPDYLEELARQLGMVKEGEILFQERKE
jgi:cell division protein FtsB